MGKTRPRDIGTAAESAVLKVLREYFPQAERSPLRGGLDQGDIMNTPFVWEVKGGHAAENASDGQIDKWLAETDIELTNRINDETKRETGFLPHFGILVTKRKGIGMTRAGEWWAHVDSDVLIDAAPTCPVRLKLRDLLEILGAKGFVE